MYPRTVNADATFAIVCSACGLSTSLYPSIDEAIAHWNMRIGVSSLRVIAYGLRHIGREGFNGYDINEEDKKLLADYADGILRAIGEKE